MASYCSRARSFACANLLPRSGTSLQGQEAGRLGSCVADACPGQTGAGKPADYDATLPVLRARRGGIFLAARREKFCGARNPLLAMTRRRTLEA